MAEGTLVRLGPVELDDCEFDWPFYLGAQPRPVTLRQPMEKLAELEALPYITDLEFTTAAEDNTAQPGHETRVVKDVRVARVRAVNDLVCEVTLYDCRKDLENRDCPMDFNLRFKDGYLQGTFAPLIGEALDDLAALVPEFNAAKHPDIAADVPPEWSLPDGILTGGMKLLRALDRIADYVNADVAVDDTGKLLLRARGTVETARVNVGAFNWVEGLEPTWDAASGKVRGLPRVIRCLYQQRHAIRATPEDARATATPDPLLVSLRQVYASGDKFLTLSDLLAEKGFARADLTDDQIRMVINTEKFDGTKVEPVAGYDTDAKGIIAIIKRDWRTLRQVVYPDGIGRRGGWADIQPGYFVQVTDKDGVVRFADQITARCIKGEWTEWLAYAEEDTDEQQTLVNAVVARSHVKQIADPEPPDAPFTARWESEADLVLRITPNAAEASAERLWLGRMVGANGRDEQPELRVQQAATPPEDDAGVLAGSFTGRHFPTVADVRFAAEREWTMQVFLVGTRRLPNNYERWTAIDIEAFPDGDVPVLDLEVGSDLFAIRDYRGSIRGIEADGFGVHLNLPDLEADAKRRVAVVIDRINEKIEGSGVAHGLAGFDIPLGRGVREVTIKVSGCVITSEIHVGNTDNESLRQDRSFRRDGQRAQRDGDKVVAGATGGFAGGSGGEGAV